jgi:hypothetical protein
MTGWRKCWRRARKWWNGNAALGKPRRSCSWPGADGTGRMHVLYVQRRGETSIEMGTVHGQEIVVVVAVMVVSRSGG